MAVKGTDEYGDEVDVQGCARVEKGDDDNGDNGKWYQIYTL